MTTEQEQKYFTYNEIKCASVKTKRDKASFSEKTELQLVYVSLKQISDKMKEKNYDFNKIYSSRDLQNIVLTENFNAIETVKKVAKADTTKNLKFEDEFVTVNLEKAKIQKASSEKFLEIMKKHKISEETLQKHNAEIYALNENVKKIEVCDFS